MPTYDSLFQCLQVLEELLYDITEKDIRSPLSVSVQETLCHVVGLMKDKEATKTNCVTCKKGEPEVEPGFGTDTDWMCLGCCRKPSAKEMLIKALTVTDSDSDTDSEDKDCACGECGVSTQGRKIRGLWNNELCEKCGESDDEDEPKGFAKGVPVGEGEVDNIEKTSCEDCGKRYADVRLRFDCFRTHGKGWVCGECNKKYR